MREYYILKIRNVGDYRKWEDIKPERTSTALTGSQVCSLAQDIANENNNVFEVRYNRMGSLQGHYVPGKTAARHAHLYPQTKGA
jgi:hypothetical protein